MLTKTISNTIFYISILSTITNAYKNHFIEQNIEKRQFNITLNWFWKQQAMVYEELP